MEPNHSPLKTPLDPSKKPLGQDAADSMLLDAAAGNQEKRQSLEIIEEAREKTYKYKSFGGQLFMGEFHHQLVFPFPEQTAEERQLGEDYTEKVMDFLRHNLDPDEVDATRTIPVHVLEELGKLGVFAMKVPKEYGGLGFSQTNYNRVVMHVASYCGATAVLISAHQSIGVPQPVKLYGTEEQKKRILPLFRQGKISAFALTEPDVGSDPAQMSATAKLSEDGSHYILNGDKLWCTNGTIADIIVVMACTAPKLVKGKEKKQISAFVVDMKTPGIEIIHRCERMGIGGIYNGLLKFTNVSVPAENLLWAEGRGLALALGTINVGRLTLPAACTGAAKLSLSIARRWGTERIQWGMPIGLHESGREKIAYIAATTLAMEAITWLTASWADQGNVDLRIESAMAKLFTTEALWKIADMTMQLRGGRGYEKASSLKARGEVPYPVERIMRDCRVNLILEGSSEIMKLFLAREAMDPHLKMASPWLNKKSTPVEKRQALFKMAKFYSTWYPKQKLTWLKQATLPDLGELTSHYRFIERQSRKMSAALFEAMLKYKQKLELKQMFLGRLVEIGTELFAMAATCSYAQHCHQKNPSNPSPLELADYFCWISRRRIKAQFAALCDNDDELTNKIAEKVVKKDFRWLEKGIEWIGPDC